MAQIVKKLDRCLWMLPVSTILIYNLIFLNLFYPITEGWFSTYAYLINHGHFPYRDFYFFLTPIYLYIISVFTSIFGYVMLSLRILGLFVTLSMTFFLYRNLEIIFGAAIASFVSIVGMIYYQSNNAHITYDFVQFVTLFALIQTYFILKYFRQQETIEHVNEKWIFLAGLFAGLTFLTKQSNGVMITAFSFTGLLLLALSKWKLGSLKICLFYISGFLVPVVITIVWLISNRAFWPFLDQIFSGAVGAKGGLNQILFAWFGGVLTVNFVERFRQLEALVLVFGYWIFISGRNERKDKLSSFFILSAGVAMLAVVLLPLLINKSFTYKLSSLGLLGVNNIIVAAISAPVICILVNVLLFILKKQIDRNIFLFSFVSLGLIYGTGTSAGITEVGAFGGFCLFTGLMLQYRSVLGLGKIFIVLFCLSFSLMLAEAKYERPYFWWNVTSPDIRSRLYSTHKISQLRGIYTSRKNIGLIEGVSQEIKSATKTGDRILLFPNIPVFYLFTNRYPLGKAVVYWFDFLPDKQALKEAEIIRKKPPKVIVYLDLGPLVWQAHERLFRAGKPSGQRKINEAIIAVIKSTHMRMVRKYELSRGVNLMVWRK